MGNACSACDRVDELLSPVSPAALVSAAHLAAQIKKLQSSPRARLMPEWVPEISVGKAMRKAGYSPKHPVACINSMVGAVLACEHSEHAPHWIQEKLVLDIAKIAVAATKNIMSVSTSDEWKAELTALLDVDDDGLLDLDELHEFVESDEDLRADRRVLDALSRARKEHARGASGVDVLAALAPVRHALELVARRENALDGLSNDDVISRSLLARHLSLKDGWKDPAGIRVRPFRSPEDGDLTAVKFLSSLPIIKMFTALMGPLIVQLEEFGYEPVKMLRAFPYDWRCPPSKLEERDGYFSNLMDGIEQLVSSAEGEKCVLVAHSMGCRVGHYFTQWVVTSEAGVARGGRAWLDKYVHSFVPIGGPFLGACSGTHQYIQPGNVSGLVPAVLSPTDGHAVMRSWGSMPFLFGTGDILRHQPASHFCWVRQQAAVLVELLQVDCGGVDGVGESFEPYAILAVSNFNPHRADEWQGLTSDVKRGPVAEFNELYQFCWDHEPDELSAVELRLKIKDEHELARDPVIAEAIFRLSSGDEPEQGPAINGHLERAEAAPVQLQPGEWIRIEGAALGASGVKVTLRICWLPAEHCRPGFTPASPDGASGCGGRADSGTSLEKQAVMVAAWGEDGSEWCPDGAYVPCSTEKMFSLEDMEDEFKVWQEHYAMDPIFSKLGTAAPPLRTVLPIYGVNKPTMAGVIYRRRVARWRQGERTCYLEPDKDATVTHTGYEVVDGIVNELPKRTLQADPTASSIEVGCTECLRVSGDRTVPYQSLRWPVTWRAAGVSVEPVEVEGGDHRGIVSMAACHFTVLQHVSHAPAIQLSVYKVELGRNSARDLITAGDSLRVRFDWHNENDEPAYRFETEPVSAKDADRASAWEPSRTSYSQVPIHSQNAILACRITLLIERASTGELEHYPRTFPVTLTSDRLYMAVRLGAPIELPIFDSDASLQVIVRLVKMTPEARKGIDSRHDLSTSDGDAMRASFVSDDVVAGVDVGKLTKDDAGAGMVEEIPSDAAELYRLSLTEERI